MESKWFATTIENATKWANFFYPNGNYHMLEVEVETSCLEEMYYVEKLDNIGPAYCSPLELLSIAIRKITEVPK